MKTFSTFILLLFFSTNFLSAQYVYDDKNFEEEEETSVLPPIAELQPVLSDYTVSAEKLTTLTHGIDTKIIIPPNAFVDRNGNVIKGEVNIQFREFNNPLDIFLSGIPMTIEENGKEEFFQSAGMVEFRANQNGKDIFPNPNSEPVLIELTSNQTDEDFQLYALDEASGEWNEEGTDQVIQNNNNANAKNPPIFESVFLNGNQPYSPVLEIGKPHIAKLNRKSLKWVSRKKQKLQFVIYGYQNFSFKNNRPNFYGKYFSEFDNKKAPVWIYDGKNKKEISALLKNFRKANIWKPNYDSTTLKDYIIEDIKLIPNQKHDNYIFEFICKNNKTYKIEAYPQLSNSPVTEQKRNKNFYKKYKSAYDKRCKKWEETDQEYKVAEEKFEDDMQKYQEELLLKDMEKPKDDNGTSRRRIGVVTFGILNIDKVIKKLNEERPLVINMENEGKAKVRKIYVLDKTNNALLSYNKDQNIHFDNQAKNSLIVALEGNNFATISQSEFRKTYKNTKDKELTFTLKNIQLELLTRKILSDALVSK